MHHALQGHVDIVGKMLRMIMKPAVKHFYKLHMVSKTFLTEGLIDNQDLRKEIFSYLINDRLCKVVLMKYKEKSLSRVVHDDIIAFDKNILMADCENAEKLASPSLEERIAQNQKASLFLDDPWANHQSKIPLSTLKTLFLDAFKYFSLTTMGIFFLSIIMKMQEWEKIN